MTIFLDAAYLFRLSTRQLNAMAQRGGMKIDTRRNCSNKKAKIMISLFKNLVGVCLFLLVDVSLVAQSAGVLNQPLGKLSMSDRMTLFSMAFPQSTHLAVGKLHNEDELFLWVEVWFAGDDIRMKRDSIGRILSAASPFIGSFVLGDSIPLFPAVLFSLHDDSKPPCTLLDQKTDPQLSFSIKDYRALPSTTEAKVSFFRDAILCSGEARHDGDGFALTTATHWSSRIRLAEYFKSVSEKYARLFYASILSKDHTVKHVTFRFRNINEKGEEQSLEFNYKWDDPLFQKLRNFLDEQKGIPSIGVIPFKWRLRLERWS